MPVQDFIRVVIHLLWKRKYVSKYRTYTAPKSIKESGRIKRLGLGLECHRLVNTVF